MTINQPYPTPMSMPRSLKMAIAGLVFQALANGLVGLLLVGTAGGEDDTAGPLKVIGVVALLWTAVLAVTAALVGRRFRWVRTAVTVVEALTILSGLVALLNGSVPGILGIAIAIGIIRAVNSAEGKSWFTA
ncbi:hypothetical protein GCM10010441_23140 [Kitasatospora paracochleata]|uniref:Uncharacterized protein n=1 Tax=Kitasatospora paracochleata TaxID=58354 RepID=A0ABT1J4Y2_9ACTN|nr:hypothetical protein [Kitasatospora paracochleata]MCP2312500.1 hypothetical protein [Kitasatospora paracochleata]